jgi:hypothetical protein
MPITLITSASYVADELAAEFGQLPAAFLPVGHNRLYDLQVAILGPGVHLTLPESFALPAADGERLAALGVNVLRVPDGLSLGHSVLYALEVIGDTPAIRILHGDTVIYDIPEGDDVLAMGDAPDAYHWGKVPEDSDDLAPDAAQTPPEVLAGYFSFGDGVAFRRCLAVCRGDFVGAINRYDRASELRRHKVASWLDCGHLQTYYRSRCAMRIQRSFNDLTISYSVVEKRSTDTVKLAGEAAWFETIPTALRLYTPAFLGRSPALNGREPGYAIEYLPSPSLHELFVFGAVGSGVWRKVMEGSFAFMRAARDAGRDLGAGTVIRQLTVDKTETRLKQYLADVGIDATQEWRYRGRQCPSLIDIARQTAGLIDMNSRKTLGIMHGDLCFTNMFYDFRTQRIKVIDPRGTIDGQAHTVLGDVRYDMAKLNHSIVGAYDFILAGRYACDGFAARDMAIEFPRDSSFDRVNALAGEFELDGLRLTDPEITAITIHLFLSMLPLHADKPERQKAFVANALRLFVERIEA